VKFRELSICGVLSSAFNHFIKLIALSVGSPSPWVAIKKIDIFLLFKRAGSKSLRSIILDSKSFFSASSPNILEYLAAVPDCEP
jgi:hypothetical protein